MLGGRSIHSSVHHHKIGPPVHHRHSNTLDAAAAEAAKAALIADAAAIEAAFKDQGAADPASEAKPEIWKEQAKFKAAADKAMGELSKLDAAAKTGNIDQIKAAFGAAGQSCKACHDAYRGK